jgi:transcriptional regulator with XRE-family HTH domain
MRDIVTRCGTNIRRLRMARALSLSELSRRSGVAKGTLSKLEASSGNPTLDTLWSIANALDVPFDDLFAEPGDGVFVVRNTALSDLRIAGVRARMIDRVLGSEANDVAEIVYIGGEVRDAVPDSPGTITRVYLAAGRLDIELPTETITLQERDFVRFHSDVVHRYDPGGEDARVLMIVSFGPQSWRSDAEDPMVAALRAAGAVPDEDGV